MYQATGVRAAQLDAFAIDTLKFDPGSVAGSLCLQVFPLVSLAFAAQGILMTSSRMTVRASLRLLVSRNLTFHCSARFCP